MLLNRWSQFLDRMATHGVSSSKFISFQWVSRLNTLLVWLFFPIWLQAYFIISLYQGCIQLKKLIHQYASEITADVILGLLVVAILLGSALLLEQSEGIFIVLAFSVLWFFYQEREVVRTDWVEHLFRERVHLETELKEIGKEMDSIKQEIEENHQALLSVKEQEVQAKIAHSLAQAKWLLIKNQKKQEKMVERIHRLQKQGKNLQENNQLAIQKHILAGWSFLIALAGILNTDFGLSLLGLSFLLGSWFLFFKLIAQKNKKETIFLKNNSRIIL